MATQVPTRPRFGWWLACGLPALVAWVVYAGSLSGDFVWDDRRLILADRAITSWDHVGEVFTNDFFYRSEDDLPYGYYRPITTLSYLVDYSLWALRPSGYHATNVALHAASSSLVAWVAGQLGLGVVGALAAATVFAVHPIHTENVAWISGRTDILAFLFGALSLSLTLRSAVTRRATASVAAAVLFALALLAKEMAIVVPLWVAAIVWVQCRREPRVVVRALAPLVGVVALYVAVRFFWLEIAVPTANSATTGLGTTILSTPSTVARYLGWLVWPYPLSAYVRNPYVTSVVDPRLWVGVALFVCAAFGLSRYWSRPIARGAGLMLLVSFLPLLNFVRVASPSDMGNTMAERFCYFPSFPFTLLLGALVEAAWLTTRRSVAAGAVGLAIVAMATLSMARCRDWLDERRFLETTLAQAPEATLLWANLSRYYLEQGDLASADRAILEIERLSPRSYFALSTRASYYVEAGRPADALPLQRQVMTFSGRSSAMATNNLAYLYRQTGQNDEALRLLNELVAGGHDYGDVHFNLAEIYRDRGDAPRAREHLRLAIADRPNSRRIAALLVTLEIEAQDLDAAREICDRLLRVYPDDSRWLNNLAIVRYRQGDVSGAIATWRQSLSSAPHYISARLNLAAALREQGDPREARVLLEAAREDAKGTPEAADVEEALTDLAVGR